jgi:TonB-linked SusC/RagA family outer membrane protein
MIPMNNMRRAGTFVLALFGMLVVLAPAGAQGQAPLTITGKVTSEFGQPLDGANVLLNELIISVRTNAQGVYTIVVPAARVNGQAVNLRARAIGYSAGVIAIRVTAGNQTHDFALKQDLNRLSEVVVTGSIEGTERSKVPFSVGRVTTEDLPVPALDPIRALEGKVGGLRIAQASGQPGSTPEILMRGPTSINASGRSQSPLIIVDGAIQRVASLDEIGGLDIESVEVVKGAAGASLYGTTAANGVIIIKTKRGAPQDGVRWTFRSEAGISDLNSLVYGQPVNHHLQLDETGKRFCVQGAGSVSACSRTMDFMQEIMRINNVAADTVRTPQAFQFNAPGTAGGELLNVYQANIWPNRYYNSFAQVATQNPVSLNSIEANGRVGSVRYFVSGSYTNDQGAIKGLNGQQQQRARVNLDYDARRDMTVALSVLFDKGVTDLRSGGSSNGGIFGQLLRGAPAGVDYSARDTLGRYLVRAGGSGIRGSGNGAGTFLYDTENYNSLRTANRFLGSVTSTYTPADWATFEGTVAYDNRQRLDNSYEVKGYRTFSASTADNSGNQSITNRGEEAMNASISATFRKQLNKDLNGKVNFRGLYDQDYIIANNSAGQIYVVKDVFTLSNTSANFSTGSSNQTIKNMGAIAGANLDWKGRYILDGTYRYDGSSLFGAGKRWAPFARVSAVWRASEEPWWKVPSVSDFRVRASRGTAGSTPRFDAQYETYSCSATGCSLGQAGNKNLTPETTHETELGADFTLFNRIGIEVTNADSYTQHQILNVPTPASLGFTSQWQNAGTIANHTWEVAANLPIISRRDLQWSVRGTWDRTRTYITELFMPEYFTSAGLGNGNGSFFLITARTDKQDGVPVNRYGNIWGRKFYKTCGDLPTSVQSQCGDGKAYQVNDQGWLVWVGDGNTWKDGITKNLWQTKLPAALSPWNYPLQFGHPIVDRPLRGEKGEGIGGLHILGNTLPNFRLGFNSTLTYKRLTLYGLLDGTYGYQINNQGEGWGIFDFNSSYFDQAAKTVQTAKPIGYSWRVGGSEGAGTGGFYDILGPNNYNVENGSYAKVREASVSYRVGRVAGIGDWTVSFVGRNLFTFTKYSGYDPEVGVANAGQANSGLINQIDAFNFPTLRTFTFALSTRF